MPVAAVELAAGTTATVDDILSWAQDRIAAYRCPRRVILVDAIPVTFALKPRRREVRARLLGMQVSLGPERRVAS
jgi:long-chain acyl-CoA synthetase